MDVHELARAASVKERRRERREGALLAVVGGLFVAAGVFVIVIGNPWMGAMSIVFGITQIVIGIVEAR